MGWGGGGGGGGDGLRRGGGVLSKQYDVDQERRYQLLF